MTQLFDRKKALDLFDGREKQFVKFGHRMVIFFDEIEQDKLDTLVRKDGSPILDWSGAPIEGKGVIFTNPTDNCLQALKLSKKSKAFGKEIFIPEKNCLIVNLGDNFEKASEFKDLISKLLPPKFTNSREIQDFINRLYEADIKDIYCSSEKWFKENTKCIDGSPNLSGANFVEARAKPVDALLVPGEVLFDSGVSATPQSYKDGAVFIRQNSEEGHFKCHGCHPVEFLHLYRIKDDTGLHSFDLSIFAPPASAGPAEVATLGMDGAACASPYDLGDN